MQKTVKALQSWLAIRQNIILVNHIIRIERNLYKRWRTKNTSAQIHTPYAFTEKIKIAFPVDYFEKHYTEP